MSSDRELLELAAKACGYRAVFNNAGACQLWTDDKNSAYMQFWNPLTDDGDAFRLASELDLTVEFGNNCVCYPVEAMGPGTASLPATRRAIVRAAAEIGRSA